MPVLQARAVRQARRLAVCDACDHVILGPHLYYYGAADVGDKPNALRLHLKCAGDGFEPKTRRAIERVREMIAA